MFYKDQHDVYRAAEMERFPWLLHGFGTRSNGSSGACGNLATLRQIHSACCVEADGRTGVLGDGDALIDDTPGAVLGVKTADCVPVLLVDVGNRIVAAVHAGWRGTVARIAAQAVFRMIERYGASAASMHAAIGPAIGKCCFEVGPEVAVQFGRHTNRKARIDLVAANRSQLEQAGIAPRRIYTAGLCTVCGGDFESYRRDGDKAGRMLSVVGILA